MVTQEHTKAGLEEKAWGAKNDRGMKAQSGKETEASPSKSPSLDVTVNNKRNGCLEAHERQWQTGETTKKYPRDLQQTHREACPLPRPYLAGVREGDEIQ